MASKVTIQVSHWWLCPVCQHRNADNEQHIYVSGDFEECQECGCGATLVAPRDRLAELVKLTPRRAAAVL